MRCIGRKAPAMRSKSAQGSLIDSVAASGPGSLCSLLGFHLALAGQLRNLSSSRLRIPKGRGKQGAISRHCMSYNSA